MDFNLLVKSKEPRKDTKFAKTLKKAVISSFVILTISTGTVVGTMFYLSNKINTSLAEQEELKKEIVSLENTEQRLVLVKDRLDKIVKVFKQDTAADEVDILEYTVNNLPSGVAIQSIKLSGNHVTVSISAEKSSDITNFIRTHVDSKTYKQIKLISLNFDQERGYGINFRLER